MRFMMMHKADKDYEAGLPPSPSLIERMNQFIGQALTQKVFIDGAGLKPSSHRLRLHFSQGKREITRGPYAGDNELPSVVAILKVRDQEDAIGWATRFAEVVGGEVELELGPVVEPWDLGVMPKPEGAVPLQVMLTHKASQRSEAGTPATQEAREAQSSLLEEMSKAGVLVSAIGLRPSAEGARLKFARGKRLVMDGPFAESKELIAGFSILELASQEEAILWATRFAAVVSGEGAAVDIEIDIRVVA